MQNEFYKFLIKHTPAAVAMFNKNMEYVAHSDRWLKDYHLEDKSLVGRSHYSVFPDLPQEWKVLHKEVIEKGKVHSDKESCWEREDGTMIYSRWECRPWLDEFEQIQGCVTFIEIITDAVETRKMLEESNEKLQKINFDLEKKNYELNQFNYIVSHDLQEPLRTIQAYSDFLSTTYEDKLDHIGQKSLSFMAQAANRMEKLIRSIFKYSKLGEESTYKNIDCNILINNVIADLAYLVEQSSANISVEGLPTIDGYESELGVLFQNLISNGIKYQKKGETSKVEISASEQDDSWLFKIKDNGIGIAKGHQEKIFDFFKRLHNKNEYYGEGIGLSHCKKIVELHKGSIWVESKLGIGSEFYFTINKN